MPLPKFLLNPAAQLRGLRDHSFTPQQFVAAVEHCEAKVKQLASVEVEIFAILGMRNLSAFVGELFAAGMIAVTEESFRKNPHQDGYPDLLLMDTHGTRHWGTLAERLRDKAPFSPFRTGGVEVKATCGTVPTDAVCIRRGAPGKPGMGDERIGLLSGYDWKAHHRDTNYLIGIVWDFIGRLPTIVAIFYCTTLDTQDWGAIVQPREGGGRTTSVSIMTRDGVRKMYQSWVCVLNDSRYITFFDRFNNAGLMAAARGIQHLSEDK